MSGYDNNSRFSGTIVGLARCHHREPRCTPPFPPRCGSRLGEPCLDLPAAGLFILGPKNLAYLSPVVRGPALMCSSQSQYSPAKPTMPAAVANQGLQLSAMK